MQDEGSSLAQNGLQWAISAAVGAGGLTSAAGAVWFNQSVKVPGFCGQPGVVSSGGTCFYPPELPLLGPVASAVEAAARVGFAIGLLILAIGIAMWFSASRQAT